MRVKMTFNATFLNGSHCWTESPSALSSACCLSSPLWQGHQAAVHADPGAGSTLELLDKSQAWIKMTTSLELLSWISACYILSVSAQKQPYGSLPFGEEISLEILSFSLGFPLFVSALHVASGLAGWPVLHDMNRTNVTSPSADGCKDSC